MSFWLVIPAAGHGRRIGSTQPKQFLQLRGRSVLAHTLDRFLPLDGLLGVQIALPAGAELPSDCNADPRIQSCVGGESRRDSVLSACRALQSRGAQPSDPVLVHDAARPLVPTQDILAVLDALSSSAAYLVAPVADTLRNHQGQTLDREAIHRVLTPQGAQLEQLVLALSSIEAELTDEAAYLIESGVRAQAVVGDGINQKITWPRDLALADALLSEVT